MTRDLVLRGLTLLLAHQPRGRARRRDRGRGARRRAARRRLGARQPARSRPRSGSAGPITSSSRPDSSARRWPTICAADAAFAPSFAAIAPLIVVQGVVSDQASGRRASRVQVYGVDDRFWRFHGVAAPAADPAERARRSSARRSRRTSARRPAAPCSSASSGRPRSRSSRCTAARTTSAARCGSPSRAIARTGAARRVLAPAAAGRGARRVRAARRLQQDLDLDGRVNTLLVSEPAAGPPIARRHAGVAARTSWCRSAPRSRTSG